MVTENLDKRVKIEGDNVIVLSKKAVADGTLYNELAGCGNAVYCDLSVAVPPLEVIEIAREANCVLDTLEVDFYSRRNLVNITLTYATIKS